MQSDKFFQSRKWKVNREYRDRDIDLETCNAGTPHPQKRTTCSRNVRQLETYDIGNVLNRPDSDSSGLEKGVIRYLHYGGLI